MKKDSKGRNLQKGERQLKSGRYEYRYVNADGKQVSVYSWRLVETDKQKGRKPEPSLREKEAEIQKAQQNNIDIYSGKHICLDQYFQTYLEALTNKESSRVLKISIYNKHISGRLGKRAIADIVTSDIRRLCNDLKERGYKRRTIASILSCIKNILESAVMDNLIIRNPAAGVTISDDTFFEEEKIKALTAEQEKRFLEALKNYADKKPARGQMYALAVLLLNTGMRVGEALALTWKDINFKKNTISITKSLSYRKTYKETGYAFHISTPKSRNSVREIYMTQAVGDVLRELYHRQTLEGFCDAEADGVRGFIFSNQHGALVSKELVDCVFDRVVKAYNKGHPDDPIPHVHAHTCRHTFVTRMVEAGANIKYISSIVGHKSIDITMSVYTSVFENGIESEMKKYEEYKDSCLA